jgi:GNAT superfamily N-acetyltransferase
MELTVRQFIRAKDKGRIRDTYIASFPKSERMPFGLMVALAFLWNTRFFAFYEGDTFCGLIYMATIGKQSFIMFFAVPEELRSKGYGAKILEKVQSMYPKNKIIVSIEPCEVDTAEREIRTRRRNFYVRNGYARTSYMMRLAGEDQEILIKNGTFQKGAFLRFFAIYSNCTMIPKIWKYDL